MVRERIPYGMLNGPAVPTSAVGSEVGRNKNAYRTVGARRARQCTAVQCAAAHRTNRDSSQNLDHETASERIARGATQLVRLFVACCVSTIGTLIASCVPMQYYTINPQGLEVSPRFDIHSNMKGCYVTAKKSCKVQVQGDGSIVGYSTSYRLLRIFLHRLEDTT